MSDRDWAATGARPKERPAAALKEEPEEAKQEEKEVPVLPFDFPEFDFPESSPRQRGAPKKKRKRGWQHRAMNGAGGAGGGGGAGGADGGGPAPAPAPAGQPAGQPVVPAGQPPPGQPPPGQPVPPRVPLLHLCLPHGRCTLQLHKCPCYQLDSRWSS